jgi:predicted CopG family antitoxin
MHECMKTITIRDETHQALQKLKEEDDSFSDVIDRLIEEKTGDIRRFAGVLKDSEVLDPLREFTKGLRASGRPRL